MFAFMCQISDTNDSGQAAASLSCDQQISGQFIAREDPPELVVEKRIICCVAGGGFDRSQRFIMFVQGHASYLQASQQPCMHTR